MSNTTVRRALLSVSDKTNLIPFAKALVEANIDIISTGGTSKALTEANIPHQPVESITKLPEMLDGRVKTLHPAIHGGILAKRDQHEAEMLSHQISGIDLVVVNFYPFEKMSQEMQDSGESKQAWEKMVEYIDIGGPTMVRAAAKNFAWVGVLTHPSDYELVMKELRETKGLSFETRKKLAAKAFALTSRYDHYIHQYFLNQENIVSDDITINLKKHSDLRYGENPHQQASAFYLEKDTSHSRDAKEAYGVLQAKQHQGKPLSYNNLLDADAALRTVSAFNEPAAVIVKHGNACGVAVNEDINEAYQSAFNADSLSAFGGVIALNQPCTDKIAKAITSVFMELIIAPQFSAEALEIFKSKPNLRVLSLPRHQLSDWEMRLINGGLLMQQRDLDIVNAQDLKVVTQIKPSEEAIKNMLFAWRVIKNIKSNAIVIAKDGQTIGIGCGQVSRVDAVELALKKGGDRIQDAVLASDAFFPFRDSVDKIARFGLKAIIQPGGSIKDQEVIDACNEYGIAMVFTGKRCFLH